MKVATTNIANNLRLKTQFNLVLVAIGQMDVHSFEASLFQTYIIFRETLVRYDKVHMNIIDAIFAITLIVSKI